MVLRAVDQTAFDEQRIDDREVEAALDARQRAKEAARGPTAAYGEANEVARQMIQRLELPPGAVARVGRWRIAARRVEPRSVQFESKGRTQYDINLAED